jgi:tRNA pseudouridine38-40 synthase
MQRFAIEIEYDGTDFFGWQRQAHKRTVQEILEIALADLNQDRKVTVIGAGRTDAGVHARAQVAHFELATKIAPERIRQALNAKTPRDIYVHKCWETAPDFHARFQARRRTYLYRILLIWSVIQRHYTWQIEFDLNQDDLTDCARFIEGQHDFSKFCRAADQSHPKICTIYESKWIKDENMLYYKIAGDRFLHSMVRMIVGTMVEIARGKGTVTDFQALVDNSKSALKTFTAPPQGLFLWQVEY